MHGVVPPAGDPHGLVVRLDARVTKNQERPIAGHRTARRTESGTPDDERLEAGDFPLSVAWSVNFVSAACRDLPLDACGASAYRERVCVSRLLLTAVFALACADAAAQGPAQASERTNAPPDRTMPGFAAMDSSIMSIEQVDPLHQVMVTMFSTVRGDDLVPRDIGVEFVPLLFARVGEPATIWEAYQGLYDPERLPAIGRYLGASIAISQGARRASSTVAVGLRTFLLAGRPNSNLKQLMDELATKSKELDTAIGAQADAGQRATAEERAGELFVETRGLLARLIQESKSRVGFLLETGAVVALDVPKNTLAEATIGRKSWWLTPIYRFDRRPVAIGGIVRLTTERERSTSIVDAGGRLTIGGQQGVQYSIEGLGRRRFVDVELPEDDLLNGRLLGGVSYAFNRSKINFIFGKNFKNDFLSSGTLVASFGLTIGFGDIPLGTMP